MTDVRAHMEKHLLMTDLEKIKQTAVELRLPAYLAPNRVN